MNNKKWLNDAIFYEIYPQSFYDSNNDGIGDIKGIIEKLDYVKSLGCNAIWLNPCFDSPFKDAGYDVRDYKKIAPRYGTNEDLELLVKKMHENNMHLLLDLVPCHTSEEHKWFIESSKQERNEYSDLYIWTDGAFNKPNNLTAVGGEKERNGTYVISFFNCQPSLNYGFYQTLEPWQRAIDSPEAVKTQDIMIDVMRFWLSKGVDGFRVDMAACLVKNDIDEYGTMKVWENMFSVIKKEFPQAAFVSEWSSPTRALKCGFDMDFYLDHGWGGGNGYHHLLRNQDFDYNTFTVKNDNSYFKTESKKTIHKFLNEYLSDYNETKDLGYISFITDNHDMVRNKKFYTEKEIRLFYGFIFTMPGVPFLYYGDEIGMNYLDIKTKEGGYHRTGSRTPMQWSNTKNMGFSDANEDQLYLSVDRIDNAPNVEDSINDDKSLLNYVKRLIKLRSENDDLKGISNFEVLYAMKNTKLFAYKRGTFVMILNPSFEQKRLKLDKAYEEIFVEGNIKNGKDNYLISPQTFAIIKEID